MDHNARYILAEILENLGLISIGYDARVQPDANIMQRYVKLAEEKAINIKDNDSLSRLHFLGLVY